MEGDGPGMVAIVQGLRDAGLAVTLVGRRRRVSATALRQSSQAIQANPSVEASTSASPGAFVDSGAQICDDRYTSSYQLAHCRARPSSPPVQLAEFPPQRAETSRTLGNFEVGATSSETKSPMQTMNSQNYSFRSSFTYVDRDLPSAPSPRATAAFAHSLRKYPSTSPNRSLSSELVQRLLAYTQAKNFSKSSYHSKNLRCLRAKIESHKENIPRTKSTKSVQTYIRTRAKQNPSKQEKKEKVKEQKKRQRAQSPVRSPRDVRYKDNHINATYDYLKSTSPGPFSTRADVRYLKDVTKCLRDTIRQICEDRPVVCPNIQSRYSRHRREHHGEYAFEDAQNTQTQESLPIVSTEVPAMSSCEAVQGIYLQPCPTQPKICCCCQKPLPCPCSSSSSQNSDNVIFEDYVDSNRLRLSCDDSSCGMPINGFENRVKDKVFNWLQEVPVYANDKPEDRSVRENMGRQLIEKLKRLKNDKDFEDKAKAAIAECVKNMPMWCPGNKDEQDLFKKQIADNLFSKICEMVNKFDSEISKWVDSLNLRQRDSQGEIIDKKNVLDNLINKLKPIALNQPADKEALKAKIVDILEELPINVDGDRKTYVNGLADDLATKLHTIPTKDISKSTIDSSEDEFEKQIWEWLNDVPELSSSTSDVKENQKSVKLLANKLNKLHAQGIEDTNVQEQMQNEINDWLETRVGKKRGLDSRTKNELAEKLLGKLVNTSKSFSESKVSSKDGISEQIGDWLNDIPELAGENDIENRNKVEKLANKLFEMRSQGKDDSEFENEILNWLTTSFEKKGKPLDVKKQSDLVNKLMNKIKTLDLKKDEELIQDILDCFGDFPELDLTSQWSKPLVELLATKIKELQSQKGNSKKEMKDEIKNFLDNLENVGVKTSTENKNQLMQKLMKIASSAPKQRKRWSNRDNLQQSIFDGISNILDGSSLNISYDDDKENIQNKISDLIARNIGTVKSGDTNDEIKMKIANILEQEAQISPKKAKTVADDIINKIQGMALPKPSISVDSYQLKNTLREEVGLLLDESDVYGDNRDEIESILTDVLADQVMRGDNDKLTKDRLISALGDSDLSKLQSEEIAGKLIDMAKEVTLSPKTSDTQLQYSDISKSREPEALSPMQKEMFKDSAEREMVDYIQEMTGDSSIRSTKKYKAAAEKLAQRIGDIMSEKGTPIADKRDDIEREISKCLQSLSISTDGSQVGEVADKLQNLAFKTSTPKRSSLDRAFSFKPRRESKGSTMSSIEDASKFKIQGHPSKEEEQYMNELVDIINSWMSDLAINLDTEEGQGFKDVMIRDLAEDIIDRQKYLQLNPDAKTSDEEELEHLKYQVFRWLNKLPGVKDIVPSISKTNHLMERIKSVPVPQLVKAPDKLRKQRNSNIQRISQDLSALQNEISKWIGAVPSKFYASRNKDYHQQLVKDLSQRIDQLHREKALTESRFDDLVTNWLSKMLKEYQEQYFKSLTEGLKVILVNKSLISLLKTLARNRSQQPLEDELRSHILDWLKEKPLYQKRKSVEKREQEQIVAELAKDLKDTLEDSHSSETRRDERVLDDIKSHIRKFPIEPHLKYDEEYNHSMATDLLKYIKNMLELFQTNSEIQSLSQWQVDTDIKEILPILEEWTDSLPLYIWKTSDEKKKLESLKQDFAKTLLKIKQQYPTPNKTASEALKKKIHNYINKLPIELAKKKDQTFVSDKINELHKKLLDDQNHLQVDTKIEEIPPILSILEECIDSLPLQIKNTSVEHKRLENLKQEFADTLHQIKQKYPTPNESASKASKHETRNYLQKLPIEPEKKKEQNFVSNKIDELHKKLLEVQYQLQADTGIEEILPILSTLEDWIDSLPLQIKNTSVENKRLESLKEEFANTLHQIKQKYPTPNESASKALKQEAHNYLQKMPIEPVKKKDQNFVSSKIDELHKKMLEVQYQLQADTGIEEILPILSTLEDWIDSLPLQIKNTSVENKRLENFKQEFANTLHHIKQKYPTPNEKASKALKQEAHNYLQKMPIEPVKKKDQNFVSSKIDELHKKLLEVQYQLQADTGIEEISPILSTLEEWIDSLPLQNKNTSLENKRLESLKQEFANNLHQIKQLHPTPNETASEALKQEIDNYIHKFPIQPTKKKDQEFVSDKIDELHKKLLNVQYQLQVDTGFEDMLFILSILEEWIDSLPLQIRKTSLENKRLESLKREFAKTLQQIKQQYPIPNEKASQVLKQEMYNYFQKFPIEPAKKNDHNFVSDKIDELHNKLLEITSGGTPRDLVDNLSATQHTMATDSTFSSKSGYRKSADVLHDNIKDWCENLPIQGGNTPKEKERVKALKKNIASKLINIIGDLNENPEIFNDDSIYEDLLNDEIDKLTSTLPLNPVLKSNLPALKDNLIKKIKEAKHKTQDELAGKAYKQQLRNAISNSLPSLQDLSKEDQAPFEVLIDNLADAYINLHYPPVDQETKTKLKDKISKEINQFCNDYLQRYPDSPVDPRKLNRELYNELQKIPAPKEQTIKSQVEQVRIKDEINDWLKRIPLMEDQSPADQLKRNKIATILAKRLHDIEKEKEFNPDLDVEEEMQKEISKWVKKLPIKPGQEGIVEKMVEQLASKLKSTEDTRRFSVPNIRHTIDMSDDAKPSKALNPSYSKFDRPANQSAPPTNRYLSQYAPPFPPSNLSAEDRAHLERIRQRNKQKQLPLTPDFPPGQSKDASVNPIPIDAGSQTDVGPTGSGSYKSIQSQMSPSCGSQTRPPPSPNYLTSPQVPITPHVLVKEYQWYTPNTTVREPENIPPGGRQSLSPSLQSQNQSRRQQPQQSPQFSWPQSQDNLSRFGLPQPQPCSEPQGIFPFDQSTQQAPGMMSPPPTMQPSSMPQPRQPQPMCMPPTQMPSQTPSMSQPQIRTQSPCISQPYCIPPQPSRISPYPSAPPCMEPQSPSIAAQPPCMMSKQSTSPPVSPCRNQCQMPETRSPCMPQYDKTPPMTTPQPSQPQMPPRRSWENPRPWLPPSRHFPPCHSQDNKRRKTRRPFRPPCFGPPEISSTSSPFDTPDIDDDISRYGPRVTHLGSLDDVPCRKSCGSQSPRAKRSRGSPNEDDDWIRFPEDEGFWGTPCPRRRVTRSTLRSADRCVRERKEEKVRCRCRERVLTKCMGRRSQTCNNSCQMDDEAMNYCSRCCGAHCPHPSYLFFR